MAKIQNLERLKEIAEELPKLEKGRSILSGDGCYMMVFGPREEGVPVGDWPSVRMPDCVRLGLLNVVNLEINHMKEELKDL